MFGGGASEEPEFESEENPSGSITVRNQRGQGHEINIDGAEANVDYRIVIEYDEGSIESDVISANQRVSPTINTGARIRSEQLVEVSLVSTDGNELASSSFRYVPTPPGPTMTSSDVQGIIEEAKGTFGPWPIFRDWGSGPTVESDLNGYSISFEWIHEEWEVVLDDNAPATEENVAWANSGFFRHLYESEYAIQEVRIETSQFRGHDEVGDPVIESSGHVVVSQSSAENVNWGSFVDNGEFPDGLKRVADSYSFRYHEPL